MNAEYETSGMNAEYETSGETEEWCPRCNLSPVSMFSADGVGVCANCASAVLFTIRGNRGLRREAERAARRTRMSQKNRKGKR